ncbi:MAG: FtsX-like permease family protein [Opitutales bacterium]|nr:FtsX-like permease family protein [Opitutales bacterium]
MTQEMWEIKRLHLKPELVWSMAMSSLRLRMGRTLLTLLTVAACCAFLLFLLTAPISDDPADRQMWGLMITLSLIVSAAGVLNTMLMSVTQRYREIGTIKCLGALDSFVLISVLVESAMLGLAGAILGIFAGLLLSVVIGSISVGLGVFTAAYWSGVFWKIGAAALVGLCLTTFGAALPAYIAAKMPPVEAMRGEK